ncbi:cytochrome c biogenesis heme-transporting ATPase CcmA [Enterobacter cancerogenus]|uniref:cytochrome c biogenesis heme-transporting ATPase CcmA n=1 Tax=Enterobacter cancerogenus TaxID=69218 RepID=UPI003076130F
MLEIRNIACLRDERTLFTHLSFAVQPGVIIQISGANGAGKSSLLHLLTGLSTPEEGEILWQGKPLRRIRDDWYAQLLWLGHQVGVKVALTADENLHFYHPDVTIEARWQALAQVDLVGFEDVPVAQLSAGQQRRVALARLWLSRATFWILDEPFTALDAAGVQTLTSRLEQHVELGGAVILTTHQPLRPLCVPLRTIMLRDDEAVAA